VHTPVSFNVLIVFVEQNTPDPIAVILCQAHTLKSSTRFLNGVNEVTTGMGRRPFGLFDLPLREVLAPPLRRDLAHDLLAVLEAARGCLAQVLVVTGLLAPPKVRSEVETAEVGHGINCLRLEWLSVGSSNEVGADFFRNQAFHRQVREAEHRSMRANGVRFGQSCIAADMEGQDFRVYLRV